MQVAEIKVRCRLRLADLCGLVYDVSHAVEANEMHSKQGKRLK